MLAWSQSSTCATSGDLGYKQCPLENWSFNFVDKQFYNIEKATSPILMYVCDLSSYYWFWVIRGVGGLFGLPLLFILSLSSVPLKR